jgi:hypothetical protein
MAANSRECTGNGSIFFYWVAFSLLRRSTTDSRQLITVNSPVRGFALLLTLSDVYIVCENRSIALGRQRRLDL